MATQLAERTASPVDVFRQTLTQPAFVEQLKMALPNHIPVERFVRVAQTAVQNNPDLLNPQKVERRSLFGALTKAAQDGLLPDGREGAIIPFKGKAVWQPMVAGIMKKVRNSGQITNWETAPVFEKDTFERLLGDDQRIYHKPYEDGDPGEVVGAYSIVTLKDGSKSRDYLPRWRIDKALAQNPMGANSLMRTKFFDEAAVKTVIKHHAKRLPMSTDVEALIERDEFMTPSAGYAQQQPPQALTAQEQQPLSRLDAIEHQIDGEIEEPVEQPEITEQAEEIEAEIAEAHPGKAIADAIIAEINDPATNAVMDVARILTKHELDIAAMLDEDAVRVEVAADKRRQAIRAEQEQAKEGAE
jgi:recombination protein RecT